MAHTAKKRTSVAANMADMSMAGGNWTEHIEKMSDLGQGYVLVKIKNAVSNTLAERPGRRARAASALPAMPSGVKKFSPAKLRQLLEQFSSQLGDPLVEARRAASARPAVHGEPDGNEQFMRGLRAQELANRKSDIVKRRLLTSTALASRLGLTTQALSKAVKVNRWFRLDGPSGRKVYPAFFADARCDRHDFFTVSQSLGDLPGPSKWEFFISPRVSLKNMSPIDALAHGMLTEVLRAAAAFKER
jgi:hypothetical protein